VKKNIFYLIVGLLSILFTFTHTWNGLKTALPVLESAGIDGGTRVIFNYVWHVVGIENLVFGIALLIMAFNKNAEKVKFTAWVIIAVLIMRWIIITIFTVTSSEGNVVDILPDTIAIFTVVVLLVLGTRVKYKS